MTIKNEMVKDNKVLFALIALITIVIIGLIIWIFKTVPSIMFDKAH